MTGCCPAPDYRGVDYRGVDNRDLDNRDLDNRDPDDRDPVTHGKLWLERLPGTVRDRPACAQARADIRARRDIGEVKDGNG